MAIYTKKQAKNAVAACRRKLLYVYTSGYSTQKEFLDADRHLERMLKKLMR